MRFVLLLLIGLMFGQNPLLGDTLYTVTDIGSLEGNSTSGTSLNNAGQVTGSSIISEGASHAFLYSDGRMTDLGTLGGLSSTGAGINNSGQITGTADTSDGFSHAFLYNNGVMADLGTLSRDRYSGGNAINDSGQVTGFSAFAQRPDLSNPTHAFLYTGGQMRILGTLDGNDGGGTAINNQGQVAGYSVSSDGTQRAFVFMNDQRTDLGTLGGRVTGASGINELGQVVGTSRTEIALADHAFLYADGRLTDLGTLPAPFSSGSPASSSARDINDSGQVVGSSQILFRGNFHAFLYTNGSMIDLNDLIDPALGIALSAATAINDQGQILANGVRGANNFGSAYLLTPAANVVPEPHRLPILGLALVGAFSLLGRLRKGLCSQSLARL